MTNSYNPIALKPIDYATPLQNVYAEQSAALDRYQAQLRERDRQEEEATLNLPEIFSKLASFSQSIGAAVEAGKSAKQSKKVKEYTKRSYERTKAGIDEDNIREGVKILTTAEALKLNKLEYDAKLKKEAAKRGWSTKDVDYLSSLHGAQILKEREFIGHQRSKYLTNNYRALLNSNTKEGREAQAAWDAASNDPKQQKVLLRQFAEKDFSDLNFDEDFVVENYWPTIEKTLETKGILAEVKYSKIRNTEKSLEVDNEIDVAIGKLSTDESALTFQTQIHIAQGVDLEKGITVEKSKDIHTNRLYRLGKAGKFQQHELDLLKNGQLGIPHAAGKTGEILLKPEQWKRIQQGINEYATATVKQHEALEVVGATNIEAQIISGEGSVEDLQKLKEDGLLRLSRTLGTNHEAYKSLDSLDPTLQSPESYAATRAEYRGYYTGSDLGKLLQNKESFKSITNKRVSKELLDKVKEAEEYLADAGLPTTWDKLLTASKDEILTSPAQQQNLKRDKVFSEETKRIQTELAQKRLQIHLYMKDKYPDPIEASAQADKAYKEWKDSEGFNVKDIPGNEEIVGRLSPNIEGEYVRAGFLREARVENNTKPSTYQIGHWSAKTQKAIIKANGNIEDMLNKPESLIDKEDALGAFIEPSQTGEFQLFYSPELVTKSLAIGKQPGYVLKKTVEALIADPTYKDYVKKFKLKEKLKILENAPDLRLKEIIDKLGDKDLITQYNYRGITSFTPKQLTRLMNLEIAMNVPIVEK